MPSGMPVSARGVNARRGSPPTAGGHDDTGGDHRQLVDSIRNRLWPLGDDVTFIPGHGPRSTFGQERRTNPFVGDGR